MLHIRDLPLEECVAVKSTTSLARVAEMAHETGARYVLVREATGDVKGVQLTTVANWMAEQAPTVTAEEIPVVEGVVVELATPVMDALSMSANSPAAVFLVREPKLGTCRVVQRSLVEMTAGLEVSGAMRPALFLS